MEIEVQKKQIFELNKRWKAFMLWGKMSSQYWDLNIVCQGSYPLIQILNGEMD